MHEQSLLHSLVYFSQLTVALGMMVILFLLLLTFTIGLTWSRFHFYKKVSFEPAVLEAGLPGVSIIKPLVGIDRNVYTSLETYFTQQYPRFELLFCMENEDDAVHMVVDTLMQKYPKVEARVFTSPVKYNVNPKINNMMQGYAAAKYELVMISDSGVKLRPDTLQDMVWCMSQKDVGLVHQMPFVEQRPGFRNLAHTTYFGCSHARYSITANYLGINCCTGMSCLMRKSVVDQLPGGLAHFGRYLAEDFFLAQHFSSHGYRTALSHLPALQDGTGEVSSLRRRLIRWLQLRTAMVPHLVMLELISECLASGLLIGWSLAFLLPGLINPAVYFLTHCLIWLVADYAMLCSCLDPAESPPFSRLAFLCSWLMFVFMLPANLLVSFCYPHIVWRDKRFRLQWGGSTKELPALPINLSAVRQSV